MKKLLIILFCAGHLAILPPANAEDTSIVINQARSNNLFSGIFESVWVRLKSINPRVESQSITPYQAYAGSRGSDSQDSPIQLYWKEDLARDDSFLSELDRFNSGQDYLDKGELHLAVTTFDAFLNEYVHSDLRPNALLGKGVSLAGLGQNEQSLAVMKQFISENPNHPLADIARQAIGDLQDGGSSIVAAK
jgi:hypothetical protein